MSTNSVSVYGFGGMGCNAVKNLPIDLPVGYGQIKPYYVDTSTSNLRNLDVELENIFLFEGIDGSGKVRAENHEIIAKNTLAILQQCKPETFSIVIHSASGGSGSILACGVVSELKKRGNQVVVIMVGSTGSHIEIENTIKSLKTYDVIAARNKTPIAVHYLENAADIPRKSIDANVAMAVLALLALFSGNNDELDTADLRNWMKHSKLNNAIISLQFCYTAEGYKAAGHVIAVATLAKQGINTTLHPLPAYQAVGFLTEHADVDFIDEQPLHFTLSSNLIATATAALNAKLNEAGDYLNASVEHMTLVNESDVITDTGIVI